MLPGLSYGSSKTDASSSGPLVLIGGGTVPIYVWFIIAGLAVLGLVLWFKKK